MDLYLKQADECFQAIGASALPCPGHDTTHLCPSRAMDTSAMRRHSFPSIAPGQRSVHRNVVLRRIGGHFISETGTCENVASIGNVTMVSDFGCDTGNFVSVARYAHARTPPGCVVSRHPGRWQRRSGDLLDNNRQRVPIEMPRHSRGVKGGIIPGLVMRIVSSEERCCRDLEGGVLFVDLFSEGR